VNFKVAFILIGAVLLIAYRFVFPWTPFWVDMSVVAAGAFIALWKYVQPGEQSDGKEKPSHDSDEQRKT
jgi:hypothetical protein